jgi:gliding motility-associated-like protein
VNSGNGGPYTYSWNGGAITSASATVTPAADSTFTVTVNDGCSLPVQASVSIVVNPVPVANFTPKYSVGCSPLTVDFADSSVTSPGSSYHWTLGDGATSSSAVFSHTYSNGGVYAVSLTVTTAQGCSDNLVLQHVVEVLQSPVANFTTSPQSVTLLAPIVDFTDLSTGASTWNWDFGDGTGTDTVRNPSYTYKDTGTYSIRLIVKNSLGCIDTLYSTIRVAEDFTIYIPNSFTPNGDGINEGFIAQGFGIKDYEMWIFNRWGQIIYHTQSLTKPWNGTFFDNGKQCPGDVYVYKIKVHDSSGEVHNYLGGISLIK